MKKEFPEILVARDPGDRFEDSQIAQAIVPDVSAIELAHERLRAASSVNRCAEALWQARRDCRGMYVLHVEIAADPSPVRRCVCLPAAFTLDEFADVIDRIMPWPARGHYLFRSDGAMFGTPVAHDQACGLFVHDSRLILFDELRLEENEAISYDHDMDDEASWNHWITVGARMPERRGVPLPLVVAGEGDWPRTGTEPAPAFSVEAANARLTGWRDAWRHWKKVRVK